MLAPNPNVILEFVFIGFKIEQARRRAAMEIENTGHDIINYFKD
jgi:hypothetical protein